MPDSATLLAFVAISAVFAAVSGPSNLFVVSQGLRAGHRAGLAAAAGCALGALTYVAATAVGLAAVLASSSAALSVLHYVGGAYLLFLGVRLLRDPALPASEVGSAPARPVPRARFLRRGLLTELSNPKVALYPRALSPVRRPEPGARPVADSDPGRDLLCGRARLGFPLRPGLRRNSQARRLQPVAAPLVQPGERDYVPGPGRLVDPVGDPGGGAVSRTRLDIRRRAAAGS
jgi:LysE type translocator